MSLWRILFLLCHGRLPPGLQPERLELAIRYALTDLTKGQLSWFDIHDGEPPLPEEVAVRLHHLASRLRQLGWPCNDDHAESFVSLLLDEAAQRFGLEVPFLPWNTDKTGLYVGCHAPQSANNCSLVAPRAYLTGWVFKTSFAKQTVDNVYAETLQALDTVQQLTSATAALQGPQPLRRKDRDDRLIFFRQVWPSRRFDLPRNAPAWLWDAIYLAGLISEELSLILPHAWHCVPGIQSLWEILAERYQLVEIAESETGVQSLRFVQATTEKTSIRVHRGNRAIDLPAELCDKQKPGTTQIWLKASEQVVDLLREQTMTTITTYCADEPEVQDLGLYLFLHTRLGRYLWALCSDQSALPDFDATRATALAFGVPVPSENVLADLSLTGSPDTQTLPSAELLEREFASIFGSVPSLPESSVHIGPEPSKGRRRSSAPTEQITTKVFQDGIPRFPEHYLMHIYRPALVHYNLCGPLEITEEFFDRISLRTIGQEHTIEVSGKTVAEALILASYAGESKVSLPEDEAVLEDLVRHYRNDLERLWNDLVRECRRFEPHRQATIKLAKKIWQRQSLPPENTH